MSALTDSRKRKDRFFAQDPHSPLSAEQKAAFAGLKYYPENPALRFEIQVAPATDHQTVEMLTSSREMRAYVKVGTFRFQVDDQPAELSVYSSGNGEAFVPFTDATSGRETYGAGRYLELEPLGGDRFQVDFNLAYNPWCVYSPHFSCPIPPQENRLRVPIHAGEKDYKD